MCLEVHLARISIKSGLAHVLFLSPVLGGWVKDISPIGRQKAMAGRPGKSRPTPTPAPLEPQWLLWGMGTLIALTMAGQVRIR